ncbi:MAG: hypothetical protein RJP95_02500 [Pirellulales bacterium]
MGNEHNDKDAARQECEKEAARRKREEKEARKKRDDRITHGVQKRNRVLQAGRVTPELLEEADKLYSQALDDLETELRGPLKNVLCTAALKCDESHALRSILTESNRIDEAAFVVSWDYVVSEFVRQAERPGFEIHESLLALLRIIAIREVIRQWRRDRRALYAQVDVDRFASRFRGHLGELLEEIASFEATLKKEADRIALWLALRQMDKTGSPRLRIKPLAKRLRESEAWSGSLKTIAKRFQRLMEKLREYLKDRGY